nr:hypothetical protein [Tanacetum cinerariifolium]
SHHVTLSSLSLSRHRPTTPVTTRSTTTKLLSSEDCCSNKWDTFINMDKFWMGTNRTNKSYVDGVAAFIDYAVYNLQNMGNIDLRVNKQHILMLCPCTKCLNHIEHKVEEVKFHLFKNGIDLSYTNWTRHGEKDEPSISVPKPVNATAEFVDNMDFASNIPTDGPATVEMVNATKDNFDEDDLVKLQELLLDAEKPLYEGCSDFTKLYAIVKLLNLKGKYGASDKFFTELLGLIKKDDTGCIAEETIAEETIEFFSEYHKSMETIDIPPDKHETDENQEGKPLSAGKSSEVSVELFQKAHLYVIQNTDEIVPYIE